MVEFLDFSEMSEATQGLIMFGSMVVAIALGVPIPFAVALGTVAGYLIIDIPFVGLVQAMYTGVEPFPLLTVPQLPSSSIRRSLFCEAQRFSH